MAIKSKDEKGKARFIVTDKIKLQALLFGADTKSLKWLLVEVNRELNKRARRDKRNIVEVK